MLRVVNFGSNKGGLATVGYAIYGVNGAAISSRTTSGVVEIGTSTGVYAANVSLPDYDCVVLWDTGEATPRYATEDYQQQITSIADQTGQIQKIYNSIKNQGEFMATLMDKLGLLEKNEGLQKVSEKVDKLAQRDNVSLTNIEEAFKNAMGKVPDYGEKFKSIESLFDSIAGEIGKIPKGQEARKFDFGSMVSILNTMQANLSRNFNEKAKDLREQILKIQGIFARFDGLLSKIDEVNHKLSSLDTSDKEVAKIKREITDEIKVIQKMLDPVSRKRETGKKHILMTLGNRLYG